MTCRAEIYTATSGQSLAVPLQAVLSNNDQQTEAGSNSNDGKRKLDVPIENYVFVLENGVSKKRNVKLGISDDSNQEIVSGLTKGDVVIIGPYKILRHLKPDEKLQAKNSEMALPDKPTDKK